MTNFQRERGQRHTVRMRRVRARVVGTPERPRAAVFRSSKHISIQIINDAARTTLVSASDRDIKVKKGMKKTDIAREVGKVVAQRALAKKIGKVVFDRHGFTYHGRIKALADSMREQGLNF
ncbi:MAG: 50S ribosomal protein L18 [Patescibacteria group bacterium]|nr:50S ribosomal protein L18 [Patescibacteria group bacterium]MDD5715359.1 50S ribosomal protein L18 [Patescibacteria group bacterium]